MLMMGGESMFARMVITMGKKCGLVLIVRFSVG